MPPKRTMLDPRNIRPVGDRVTDRDADEGGPDTDAFQDSYNAKLDPKALAEDGYTPEAIQMMVKLNAAGLHPELAKIATTRVMGLDNKPLTPEQQWESYAAKHPNMAAGKRFLEKGLPGYVAKGIDPMAMAKQRNEQIAAHSMLQEYLHAQDALRAGEAEKQGLWMVARMPGAPLAGAPVYSGPTVEPPIAPPPMINMPEMQIGAPAPTPRPMLPGEQSRTGPIGGINRYKHQ